MKPKTIAGIFFAVSIILLTILVIGDFSSFQASQTHTVTEFVEKFSSSLSALLGLASGFFIGYMFWFKTKIQEFSDAYINKCANYDQFLSALKALKNRDVDYLVAEWMGTLEAPELCIFDSRFLEVARELSSCPKSERLRLLSNLKSQITPTKVHIRNISCHTAGCDHAFQLSFRKGEHYNLRCPKCGRGYAAYVSKNDKIVIKPKPKKPIRVTATNFDEDMPNYLIHLQANFSPEMLMGAHPRIVLNSRVGSSDGCGALRPVPGGGEAPWASKTAPVA